MTKEEYKEKAVDLKSKFDAFLTALEEVYEARRLEIDEDIFVEEIEEIGNLTNTERLEQAQNKLCQLRMWNPKR